jgi:uncharacterized protein YjbI with pentapeptide repeats
MANADHMAVLMKGPAIWNAWRDENPNISRANLTGADLTEANLTGTEGDLRGANLRSRLVI